MKVVILPGLDGTGLMLSQFVNAIDNRYGAEIISYPTNQTLDYCALADLVQGSLPIEEPYVIFAESFSGSIAIEIASRQNADLAGIIFVASFAKKPTLLPSSTVMLTKAVPLNSKFLLAIANPFVIGKWQTDEFLKVFHMAMKRVSKDVLTARLKEVMNVDTIDKLEHITVPILYLRAKHDRLVPSSSAEAMSTKNDRFKIKTIAGPHFLLQAQANKCAEITSDFASTCQHKLVD